MAVRAIWAENQGDFAPRPSSAGAQKRQKRPDLNPIPPQTTTFSRKRTGFPQNSPPRNCGSFSLSGFTREPYDRIRRFRRIPCALRAAADLPSGIRQAFRSPSPFAKGGWDSVPTGRPAQRDQRPYTSYRITKEHINISSILPHPALFPKRRRLVAGESPHSAEPLHGARKSEPPLRITPPICGSALTPFIRSG